MYNKTVIDSILDTRDNVVAVVVARLWEILATLVFLVLMRFGERVFLDFIHVLMLLGVPYAFLFPAHSLAPWVCIN